MKVIDLRSDTVTRPSPGMREAIFKAEVGDDVFEDDPTVKRLEEMLVTILGKEAALFVPSGTMANQVAINAHTQPGDEVIVERDCHTYNYEVAAHAVLSGVQLAALQGHHGILTAEQVSEAIRADDVHLPRTSLICLENTHNRAGGVVYPIEEIKRISRLAKVRDLRMHLDGARLFNASMASGIPANEYARHFDSVSICLSKGLGAPVGSMIVGQRDFIKRCRRYRKMYGGGMRQVGILAAAGIYALENNIERLSEDHKNARLFAEQVSRIPGIEIDIDTVQTNIVVMDIAALGMDSFQAVEKLQENGCMVVVFGPTKIRAVTHLDVDEEDVLEAIGVFQKTFSDPKL
ncbi:MAG: threonine aldolase [candidate division Zixibacteria bacterium SM23_81]|nr:MAG: threonine aldolase [candidate division Zixibacteria bacterium SM23_81]